MTPYTSEDLAQARALATCQCNDDRDHWMSCDYRAKAIATALHLAHQAGVAEGRTLGIEETLTVMAAKGEEVGWRESDTIDQVASAVAALKAKPTP